MIIFFKNYENTDEGGIYTYVGTILDGTEFWYSVVIEMNMNAFDGKMVPSKITYRDLYETNSFEEKIDYKMLQIDPNMFAMTYLLEE